MPNPNFDESPLSTPEWGDSPLHALSEESSTVVHQQSSASRTSVKEEAPSPNLLPISGETVAYPLVALALVFIILGTLLKSKRNQ